MAWEDSAALSKHTQNILTFPSHEWTCIGRRSYFIRFLSRVTETAVCCSNQQTFRAKSLDATVEEHSSGSDPDPD
jgi:hypothetical protein